MNIGFIGAGNMATAIIGGAVLSGNFSADTIGAYDLNTEKTEHLYNTYGIHAFESVNSLLEFSDAVVLAVKPNVFPSLLPTIADTLSRNQTLVISIAAGKTIDYIQNSLNFDAPIIRIMPNINATVGEAMSAYCYNEKVSEEQKKLAKKLCESFGRAMDLEEKHFSVFGVIAGAAPAYSYMFIDALARAGVKNGLSKQVALEIAAQTVLGSAKNIAESNVHPWELIDRVCSPGGTTIEGVVSLQRDGLDAAVIDAVDAALAKDKKL